jgi:hypothetical protein
VAGAGVFVEFRVLPFEKLSLKKVVAADAIWTEASSSEREIWGDFIVIFQPGFRRLECFGVRCFQG